MAHISMIIEDNTILIDGTPATGINFSGIDPNIHAIQWYGTYGEIEFKYTYSPGVEPTPNEPISSLAAYQSYVLQAEAVINAELNPVSYYFTEPTDYLSVFYEVGDEYVSTEVGWPVPPNAITLAPPVVQHSYQALYYYSGSWLVSTIDPTLDLATAKSELLRVVRTEAAALVNYQLRRYSWVQILEASNVRDLATTDYSSTVGEYQDFISNQVAALESEIIAAINMSALYNFDPSITSTPPV